MIDKKKLKVKIRLTTQVKIQICMNFNKKSNRKKKSLLQYDKSINHPSFYIYISFLQ